MNFEKMLKNHYIRLTISLRRRASLILFKIAKTPPKKIGGHMKRTGIKYTPVEDKKGYSNLW
jgi:hypothetical protein